MKVVRFRVNDWESYGIVEGDRIQRQSNHVRMAPRHSVAMMAPVRELVARIPQIRPY